MNTPLEQSLATTLEDGVRDAAPPDPEFFVAVHRRVRHRRRRRRVMVAGCASVLALAVGATTFAVAGTDRDPVAATTADPTKLSDVDTTKLPDFANLAGPREVWPEAVGALPHRLPDGRIYKIKAILPDNRYLVLTGPKPAEHETEPENGYPDGVVGIFDVGRNTLTPVSDPNASAGTGSYRNVSAGVVGDYVMWFAFARRGQKEEREVWSAKLADGGPRRLVTLTAPYPSAAPDAFGVAHDGVMWRMPTPGRTELEVETKGDERRSVGFYRLGPAGGTPELVPGSEGFTPAAGGDWFTSAAYEGSPAKGQLWNLATGERRTWTRNPAAKEMLCGPLWCGGVSTTDRPAIQKLDGSGYVELPPSVNISPTYDGRLASYIYRERPQGTENIVWDLSTGRAAKFSVPSASSPTSSGGGRNFVAWEQDGKLILLTFPKIR